MLDLAAEGPPIGSILGPAVTFGTPAVTGAFRLLGERGAAEAEGTVPITVPLPTPGTEILGDLASAAGLMLVRACLPGATEAATGLAPKEGGEEDI